MNSISVKEPTDVTEPKPFNGAMWILLRVTKQVMVPVCAHPINWTPLTHQIKSQMSWNWNQQPRQKLVSLNQPEVLEQHNKRTSTQETLVIWNSCEKDSCDKKEWYPEDLWPHRAQKLNEKHSKWNKTVRIDSANESLEQHLLYLYQTLSNFSQKTIFFSSSPQHLTKVSSFHHFCLFQALLTLHWQLWTTSSLLFYKHLVQNWCCCRRNWRLKHCFGFETFLIEREEKKRKVLLLWYKPWCLNVSLLCFGH